MNQAAAQRLNDDGTADLVQSLINDPLLFALTILGVNTVKMGALTIVLPSMIVPFAGIPLFAYRALTTGVTLVPASDIGWVALIPHSLTLVVELQAYILFMLGAYLLGSAGSGREPLVPITGEEATAQVYANSVGYPCPLRSCL